MHIDRPIAIALILFVILLLIFFLVVPEYKTFQNLQTQLGIKTAEFNAEFDYYNAIAKTYAELQSRKDDVAKIDDALPQNSDFGNTVYFLQQTAKDNGLTIKNLFLSKSASSSAGNNEASAYSVKDITFSMSISGDYPALENFLVSLEKSSRIFEISSISFGSSIKPPYNFSLQIKTHSY